MIPFHPVCLDSDMKMGKLGLEAQNHRPLPSSLGFFSISGPHVSSLRRVQASPLRVAHPAPSRPAPAFLPALSQPPHPA